MIYSEREWEAKSARREYTVKIYLQKVININWAAWIDREVNESEEEEEENANIIVNVNGEYVEQI